MINIDNWICTDPDNLQFVIHRINHSEFKEFNRVKYPLLFERFIKESNYDILDLVIPELLSTDLFVHSYIYENNYHYSDIKNIVDTYGYILNDDFILNGYSKEDSIHLIRECIFEQTNGLY